MSSRPDGSHADDDAAAARAERRVEEYLDRLCEPLAAAGVPAPERSELRQEAAAHIAWLVEEFLQQGRSPLEATHEALEEFGPDPVRVGRAMAGGWLRRRRRLPRWGGDISPRRSAVARPELVLLFRGLAAGLRAGLALADALAAASRQVRNARLRSALSDVAQQVNRGRRLSEAMGRHPGWFPELHRALVQAGERSDTLATALLRAADDLERERIIRRQVRGAFAYSLGFSLLGLTTVLFLLCYVVPIFDKVYRQFRAPLPAPTRMLFLASELFTGYWWVALLASGIGALAAGFLCRTERGRRLLDGLKIRLPVVGGLIYQANLARMSHALAALTEVGVPLEPALRLAGAASSCIPAADALTEAASRVLLEPDGASGLSPEDMKRLPRPVRQWAADAAVAAAAVKRGSSGGDAAELARLSGLLEWVGRRSDQDLGRALKHLRTRMEPLLTLLFGGMIALILICLYYPIFGLGNVVS